MFEFLLILKIFQAFNISNCYSKLLSIRNDKISMFEFLLILKIFQAFNISNCSIFFEALEYSR